MAFGIGIIGCGGIGGVHALAATRAGLPIVAVWDIKPERAQQFAQAHGARACASIDDLLAIKDVVAVAVCVPNDQHHPCAMKALAAGKHVLLEKPMAMDVAQCDEIAAAAARARTTLQIGFVCRGSPAARCVKSFIDAGRFGAIQHIKCALYRRRGIPGLGGWFTTKARSGGGPLIDLGVHMLDLSLWLAGSPRPLRASGATSSGLGAAMRGYTYTWMWAGPPKFDGVCDVEDSATALVRCDGGLTIEMNVTWAANLPDGHMKDGVCVIGSKAGAAFQVFGKEVSIATEEEGHLVDLKPHFVAEDPERQMWDEQYRQFIDAVEGRSKPHADAAAGRRVQSLVEAIYRSAAEDREVEVGA
jgi:predicted dehydrogenase